jgi:hypothetical protein
MALIRKIIEFLAIYSQYRPQHSRRYSAQIAWGIAFRGLHF